MPKRSIPSPRIADGKKVRSPPVVPTLYFAANASTAPAATLLARNVGGHS